jgi:D-alanine-D-alanine ligase
MTTTQKIRLGLIFGGRSGEHEISLRSARSVLAALNPEKYEVIQIGITHEGAWLVGEHVLEGLYNQKTENLIPAAILPEPNHQAIFTIQPTEAGDILAQLNGLDVVFPLMHGTFGEDGTIQGLFELADLAYVGSGVLGSSVGMDKALFKDVMRSNGIPVVESITILSKEISDDLKAVVGRSEQLAHYPLFIKPANLGSSVGISKAHNRTELVEGLKDAARYDRRVLVERGVDARELEVSVLGNDQPSASAVGEILPADEFYSYGAKYHDDRSQTIIPAQLPDEVIKKIQYLAVKSFLACDCSGLARADFLLDKHNHELFLNEINTIPGFTDISMYPKLWIASGMTYPELVDHLIELALERKGERDRIERRYRFGSL